VPGLTHTLPFTKTLPSIIKEEALLLDNVCPAIFFSANRMSNLAFSTLFTTCFQKEKNYL